LRDGNEAQRWLRLYHQGLDCRSIITQAIQQAAAQETALEDELCSSLLVA
jgi:hypothetical protein